jgi:tight adherence protein B
MEHLPLSLWLTAGGVFLSVTLAAVSIALVLEWLRTRGRRRDALKQLRAISRELGSVSGSGTVDVFRPGREPAWVTLLAARIPRVRDFALRLEQSETGWSLRSFLFATVGLSAGLGAAAWIVTQNPIVAAVAAALGAVFPFLRVQRRRRKRFAKFEAQLPEAIDLLCRAIRSGHPLAAGLRMVADETPAPIGPEFRRLSEEQRFGMPFDDSMLAFADRVPLMDTRILVAAVLIQREVGGNLAEILDNLAYVIRERFKIRRQVRVYTAQGRMTGYLLSALPVALFSLLYLVNAEYMRPLFTQHVGRLMIGAGLGLQLVGFLWVRKIVNIEI